MKETNKPRGLIFDIETAPIQAYVWGLYDQNVGLNQIKSDWHLLAWSAKWLGDPASKTMYMDNSKSKDIKDDKALVGNLSELINEADFIITQNGEAFDVKKLNARAVINGLDPIKPVRSTDILKEGRKVFKFTSHKLEYVTNMLNKKYKKLKHSKYPGFELWSAVLSGDKRAWAEMRKYTIHDVLSTEEAYLNIQGWIKTQNMASYLEDVTMRCKCGSDDLESRGYAYTDKAKFQVYRCNTCGKWPRSTQNLLSVEKKKNLLKDGK